MRRDRRRRKVDDLLRLRDVDAMGGDLARSAFGDLGGDRLQAALVAIGQRQIAASRGKFQRQRTADATGRAGDGGGGATDCSHEQLQITKWKSVAKPLYGAKTLA